MKVESSFESTLVMKDLYFKTIHFENRGIHKDKTPSKQVTAAFNVSKNIIDKNNMNITLRCDISMINLLEITLELYGEFELTTNREGDNIEKFLSNAVAIMFPFLRSQISLQTSQPNLKPLLLPAININKLLEDQANKGNV